MLKNKKSIVKYASFVAIVVCILLKIILCSVSIDGDLVHMSMTSDYWNFGKELLGGKILYRDIIDHKGLYLYLIYAFMGWVSNNNIAIVVLFETLLYTSTIFIFFHYLKKYGDDDDNFLVTKALVFSIAYLLATYKTTLVNTEGIVAFSILLIWSHIKEKPKMDTKCFAFVGLLLGILFQFKVTAILPFAPIFVHSCALHLKNKGTWRNFLKFATVGLLCFVMVNVPFVIYMISNGCLDEFLEINKCVLGKGGQLNIIPLLLPVVLSTIATICLLKRNERYSYFLVNMSILTIALQFGSMYNYYIPMYMAIFFMEIFQCKKVNIVSTILMILLLWTPIENNIKSEDFHFKTREISEKYEIDSSNILYLCEDYGFGVYSKKLYKEPLQWIPAGMLYSKAFSDYYTNLTIERLENKSFKYVFFATPEQISIAKEIYENKDKLNLSRNDEATAKFYCDIHESLVENYKNSKDIEHLYIAK